MRKHDAIDLLALHAKGNHVEWNTFLSVSLRKQDLEGLATMRYRLQAGMVDLAKRKLNTEQMIVWFIRLQNSIESTMKRIIRRKYPNPCDDPLKAVNFLEAQEVKRRRDQELDRYLRKTGY